MINCKLRNVTVDVLHASDDEDNNKDLHNDKSVRIKSKDRQLFIGLNFYVSEHPISHWLKILIISAGGKIIDDVCNRYDYYIAEGKIKKSLRLCKLCISLICFRFL